MVTQIFVVGEPGQEVVVCRRYDRGNVVGRAVRAAGDGLDVHDAIRWAYVAAGGKDEELPPRPDLGA